MSDVWWALTRATGIVATVLGVAAMCWGFFFSARETGRRLKPAWWLDLHNWLGGLALVFTLAHVVTALLATDLGVRVIDSVVPLVARDDRWALAFGVVAMYLFALAVLTSWPRRRFARRTWRVLHLGSVLGVALAMVHAVQMGSDASTRVFRIGLLAVFGFGVQALSVRLLGVVSRMRAGR